jgi:hypothetical protein
MFVSLLLALKNPPKSFNRFFSGEDKREGRARRESYISRSISRKYNASCFS